MADIISTERASEASSLKSKGNSLFRDGKFLESIIEYTAGIELDNTNPILYSNRSLSFLKMGQHFYALKDAETTIHLKPDWSKGYYRKGQVEEATEQYQAAKYSYERGLAVCPCDEGLQNALANLLKKHEDMLRRRSFRTKKLVMAFSICSTCVLAIDMYLKSEIFSSPLLRLVLIFLSMAFGIFFAQISGAIHDANMKALLAPPKDLLKELENESTLSNSSGPDAFINEAGMNRKDR